MPPRRWGAPLGWGLAVLFRSLKATKAPACAVATTAGPRSAAAPHRPAWRWALPGLCVAWWAQAALAQGARTEAVLDAAAASAPAAGVEAAPPPVPLPPPPVVHAFQGLPWGASEAQIAQRFGGQLQQAQCAPVSRRQPERTREVCDHPYVPQYEVAGVPFRLTFHLDTQTRQLVRVSLSYAGEAATPPGGAAAAADNRWGERHRVLRNLLAQRYGGPETTHVSNEPGSFVASARWRVNGTVIDLNSMFFHRAANGPAREQYDIGYQPVTAGDAGKL